MKRMLLSIVALLVLLCGVAVAEGATIVASGDCSANDSNVIWALDSEGTLTISGKGMMCDYYEPGSTPWYSRCASIKTAVIEKGVTSIGNYAFYNCSSLSSITIPDSVTSIDEYAFCECRSLSSITIPEGVTSIGNSAFWDCSSLSSITIPDGLISIGNSAFYGCSSQKKVYVDTLEGWLNISFSVHSSTPLCYGGELYIAGKLVTDLVLPEGMTSVGRYAFYGCSSLSSITIPDGVTSIGEYAFSGCSSLSSITIPDGVTSIGNYAFRDCSSLSSITIPDGVTSIGYSAFSYCSSLSSITIPDGVTSIGNSAFYGCSSLSSITIPGGVTSIGVGAFSWCSSLSSITIPDGVTSIDNYAFEYCYSLQKVMFLGNDMPTLGSNVFSTSPTIYCYEFSDVDFWAVEKGYNCVYIDDMDLNTPISITLPQDMWIEMGENRTISAGLLPQTAKAEIVWESSDPSVVSVENGVLTALAVGKATITASCDELSDQMSVTVYASVESFELSEAELWIISKETAQLDICDIEPVGVTASFTWESSNTSVLTVNGGKISALKPGDATVTVTSDNGVVRSCLVHVCYPVTAIALEQSEYLLEVGDDAQITANVTMRSQSCVNKLVTFASSDEAVATVDQTGSIHAVSPGTATITVSAASGVTASCAVTVEPCTHTPVTDPAVPATCTETGLTEGSHCSVCGEVLVAQEVVPVLDHTPVTDPAVPATHVTSGLTEGSHCSVCGEVLVAQQSVPMVEVSEIIALPAELKTIEAEAFAGDTFVCVVLPDGCKAIGAGAFRNCAQLRFVEIPDTVTSIDGSAFEGCGDNLIIVTVSGSEAERFANVQGIICVLC